MSGQSRARTSAWITALPARDSRRHWCGGLVARCCRG